MAWSLCITNLKIANSFLKKKKKEIIVAIKSQRYLSTCPTAQLHIPGIFLKTVLNKSVIFFKLCYICYYYLHISEVNELHERHKKKNAT